MDKKIITFDDIEIEQSKFHHYFNLILFDHLNIDDTQVSSMYSFGKNTNISLFTKIMII